MVPDEQLASALTALPENRGLKIQPGKLFEMAPCRSQQSLDDPTSYWREQGRECPYIELDIQNELAATLLLNHLPEHTRFLTAALAEALLADLSAEERGKILMRISSALRSEAVIKKLYPSLEAEKK